MRFPSSEYLKYLTLQKYRWTSRHHLASAPSVGMAVDGKNHLPLLLASLHFHKCPINVQGSEAQPERHRSLSRHTEQSLWMPGLVPAAENRSRSSGSGSTSLLCSVSWVGCQLAPSITYQGPCHQGHSSSLQPRANGTGEPERRKGSSFVAR